MTATRELERDAREHCDDLIAARRRLATDERSSQAQSALAAAVAQAQRTLTSLDKLRQRAHGSSARQGVPPRLNRPSETYTTPPALLATLDRHRAVLRRELPRAVAVLERLQLIPSHSDRDGLDGRVHRTEYSYRASSDAADALRSLVRTRKLLSLELSKVDTAMTGLSKSTAVLDTLRSNLQDVQDGMARARRAVRVLLTIESRDDVILRVAILFFVGTIVYVLLHRVLRLFPRTVYVELA